MCGMGALPSPSARQDAGLSERDRSILDFERDWTGRAGEKDAAVRERFGLSTARYYQVLNALLDSADATRYDALLVSRLRRLRDARAAARAARSYPRRSDASSGTTSD